MYNQYQSTVKFQDAFGFYDTLYRYKAESSDAGEKASTENLISVINYYVKLKKLYKYVCAYILENTKCKILADDVRKVLREDIKPILIRLDQLQKRSKDANQNQIKQDLLGVIEILEDTEEKLYKCIKSAQIELPLDNRNPHKSIQEQEI